MNYKFITKSLFFKEIKMKKIEVDVNIKIDDVELHLSEDEMKELSFKLDKVLGKQQIPYIPYPVYPSPIQPWITYPIWNYNEITCDGTTTGAISSDKINLTFGNYGL